MSAQPDDHDVTKLLADWQRGDVAAVPRQYCGQSKTIDVGVAGRHSTGDASHRQRSTLARRDGVIPTRFAFATN
jgi:hypothetical protein